MNTAWILYKNWKDETTWRHIQPISIWYGHTEWHKEDQWLLKGLDVDKGAERDFAMAGIFIWLTPQEKEESEKSGRTFRIREDV